MNAVLTALGIVAVGIAIGLAAGRFTRGRVPEVFFTSAVLGVSGALAATLLGIALDCSLWGFVGLMRATVGAVVTIALYHLLSETLGV